MNIGMHNHCVLLLPVFKHPSKNKHPMSIGTRNHTYKIRELKITKYSEAILGDMIASCVKGTILMLTVT